MKTKTEEEIKKGIIKSFDDEEDGISAEKFNQSDERYKPHYTLSELEEAIDEAMSITREKLKREELQFLKMIRHYGAFDICQERIKQIEEDLK